MKVTIKVQCETPSDASKLYDLLERAKIGNHWVQGTRVFVECSAEEVVHVGAEVEMI